MDDGNFPVGCIVEVWTRTEGPVRARFLSWRDARFVRLVRLSTNRMWKPKTSDLCRMTLSPDQTGAC